MKEKQIESIIFTVLHTWREHVISKKIMKQYYNGEIKVDRGLQIGQDRYQESTLDDMESFITDIVAADIKEVDKYTFFLPKLTQDEMQLIEDQDIEYKSSFQCYIHRQEDPNVKYLESESLEMLERESKTKYVAGGSRRLTLLLKIPFLNVVLFRFLKFMQFKSSSNGSFSCCQPK